MSKAKIPSKGRRLLLLQCCFVQNSLWGIIVWMLFFNFYQPLWCSMPKWGLNTDQENWQHYKYFPISFISTSYYFECRFWYCMVTRKLTLNVPKQSCNSEITETDSKNQPFWHAYKLIYFSAYLQLHVCTSYVGRKYLLTRVLLFNYWIPRCRELLNKRLKNENIK